MFAIPLQLLKYCADWLDSIGWSTVLVICALGYLVAVKIVLICKLHPVAGKAAVHRATTPMPLPTMDRDTTRDSAPTAAHVPRVLPAARSRGNTDTSADRQSPTAAATITRPSELAALDWTSIDCQNNAGCDRPADYIVEYHAIDHCLDDGTNALGNLVEIVCRNCLAFLQITIDIHIDRLVSQGRELRCLTCGKPLAWSIDVLRSVLPLHGSSSSTLSTGSPGPRQPETAHTFIPVRTAPDGKPYSDATHNSTTPQTLAAKILNRRTSRRHDGR